MALIPKSDGGLRPIALFRTAYRIYAKAHARRVRDWASRLPDAQCNNSKGRWVGDSTWRAQIRVATRPNQKHHIELLLDVKKAFEHVRRGSVAREAKLQDYPLVPLLASLTSYAWPRYIGLDGLLAEPIVARIGIAAGSAFATFELWCLLRNAINSLQIAFPRSTICIHVDDLCLTVVEDTAEYELIEAKGIIDRAICEFTEKEGLPFADDKTLVIASTFALVKTASRVILPSATAAASVRRLGVDYSLARAQPRRKQLLAVHRGRAKASKVRSMRLKKIAPKELPGFSSQASCLWPCTAASIIR